MSVVVAHWQPGGRDSETVWVSEDPPGADSKCQHWHYLSLLSLMHQEIKCYNHPPTKPPVCIYYSCLSFFFCLSLKHAACRPIKSFQALNGSKTPARCSTQRIRLFFLSKRSGIEKGFYFFQDAGEPLRLTVDDNLSLLSFVQILEHFQERGLRHGLHVHRRHLPVPLCCRV